MDYVISGLPAHILLIHVIAVGTPLVLLLLITLSLSRRARRVLWIPVLVAAAFMLVVELLTVEAGEWLAARIPSSPLIAEHTSRGENLTPWMWAILLTAVIISCLALLERQHHKSLSDSELKNKPVQHLAAVIYTHKTFIMFALLIITASIAVLTTVTLVDLAEAGSRAVWQGSFSNTPLGK